MMAVLIKRVQMYIYFKHVFNKEAKNIFIVALDTIHFGWF